MCPHSCHTQGPGDVTTRAHPQKGEVFLSNISFSGLRSPLAQSWDSTNRAAATRPTLSTTVGDREMGMGEGVGGAPLPMHRDWGLQPVPSPGSGSGEPVHHTGSCENPVGTSTSGLD